MKRNAQNQKDWADQQLREKRQAKAQEDEDERQYALQTEAITRMRGMLEDEASQKKAAMQRAMMEENKRLALEKRRREEAWKQDQQEQDKAEVTLTNHDETLDADGKVIRHSDHAKNWILIPIAYI